MKIIKKSDRHHNQNADRKNRKSGKRMNTSQTDQRSELKEANRIGHIEPAVNNL